MERSCHIVRPAPGLTWIKEVIEIRQQVSDKAVLGEAVLRQNGVREFVALLLLVVGIVVVLFVVVEVVQAQQARTNRVGFGLVHDEIGRRHLAVPRLSEVHGILKSGTTFVLTVQQEISKRRRREGLDSIILSITIRVVVCAVVVDETTLTVETLVATKGHGRDGV